MKKLLPLILSLSLNLFTWAQDFSIDGITGISFSESDSDYSMAINDAFVTHGINIQPNSVTLDYNSSENSFNIFGDVDITFDGESINSNINFSIENKIVQNISFDVTTDFSLKNLTMTPKSLGFIWNKSESQFEMYGSITSEIESNSINLSMGDISEPGVIIENGTISEFNMGVTADFDLFDITLKPKDLTFSYNNTSVQYEMYGTLDVSFDGETMEVTLGDVDKPGLEYRGNTIEKINMGISSNFSLKGLQIEPQNLIFEYVKSDNYYKMHGFLRSSLEGNQIELQLGISSEPGLIIENGEIKKIETTITADFSFSGVRFEPNNLTFLYNESSDLFEMYGETNTYFDGESVLVSMGTSNSPGLEYKNSRIQKIDIGVTSDFKLKELEIKPTDLTFIYDKSERRYEMYGDISFKVGDDEIEAILGDASDPGMVYEKAIKHVNIGVSTEFKISGLKIKATDVGLDWSSGSYYHLYGDADLSIANDDIDADFGTFSNPGIKIKSGVLHSLEVDLNSDLKLGGLELETKDLDVKYSNKKFEVTGELTVTEVFSLSVILGQGKQGGLEIDVSGNEPKFKLEDFTIDIEHANLGAIDLKQIKLEFNSNGIVESDVKILFPEGWEVDAVMKFKGNPSKIDAIDISYRADNLEEAIEIFEGVQLTYLDGNISNITRPSKLTVGASIGTIYGGGFTLDNKSATFLETGADVTISKSSFRVKGDVNVGAYREGTNYWKAILGDGSIDLYADFGHYVKVDTDIKYPGDPLIEAKINASLDSHGHFDALVDVGFIVPHWVPFIGGKHYGSVDGAVRYKKGYLKDSFGAGWVRIKTFWHTYHEGAKFNFGTRKISSIGSGTIKSIERDIENDERKERSKKTAVAKSVLHTFTVSDPAPNTMLIDIDWEGEVSEALIHVVGPEGIYELTKAVVLEENDINTTPTMGYEENMTTIAKDTVTTFLFTTTSAFSEEEIIHADLMPGRYQLVVSFPGAVTPIDTIQFKPKWQLPSAEITATKNEENKFDLDIAYWSSLPDSTFVSFYANTTESYEESRLINHIKASNFNEEGYGSESLTYAPHTVENDHSQLFFYAVIEDGINPPLRTEISESYSHSLDLKGTITLSDSVLDLDIDGLRIFIDEDDDGYFDTKSTGGLEKFALSNLTGYYSFRDLNIGTHSVRIVLPEGYRIIGETDRFSSLSITFDGEPFELNFEIETY